MDYVRLLSIQELVLIKIPTNTTVDCSNRRKTRFQSEATLRLKLLALPGLLTPGRARTLNIQYTAGIWRRQ